jgi:hypothetical protein
VTRPRAATAATVDPLTVKCSWCWMPPGEPCSIVKDGRVTRPHKARIRVATRMAAHADPALDAWPQLGPVTPCGLCRSGLPQRHRIVDVMASRMAMGEVVEDLAADYPSVPVAAIEAVAEWSKRWLGGWE